jgi:hypothetical protein
LRTTPLLQDAADTQAPVTDLEIGDLDPQPT